MRSWRCAGRRGWALISLALACTEGPTEVGRLGELSIVPAFADGEAPTQLQVSVDTIVVLAHRTRGSSAVVIDTVMAYAPGASLSWLVELLEGEDSVSVDVTLRGGGSSLYEGARSVVVPEATGEARPAHPVAVRYMGPAITTSVVVTPPTAILNSLSDRVALHADAYRSTGTQITDATFTWTSSDPAVAAVDPITGVVTPLADGDATITAAYANATGSALITVAQSITTIVISPSSASLAAIGLAATFQAEARDGAGTVLTGVRFSWSTSSPSVATITEGGVATAVGVGETRLTASAGGASATASLTVRQDVASVDVAPQEHAFVALGSTVTFTGTARDANGHEVPGAALTWSSSNPTVASVGASTGVVTSVAEGTARITARSGSVGGQGTVRVSQEADRIEITPTTVTFGAVGARATYSARLLDLNGRPILGASFVWTSADPTVVSIDRLSGVATAVATGTTQVTARSGTVSGSAQATVTVDAPGQGLVIVAPSGATLTTIGATQQYSATAYDAEGHPVPGATFVWSSLNPAVATVTPSGVATAVTPGTTSIAASFNGTVGRATLSVAPTVVSLTVSPPSASLTALGAQQAFTAEARDASGHVVNGAPVAWSSSDPAVLTIQTTSGIATAVGIGRATVVARIGNVSDDAAVVVQQQIAFVDVTPSTAVLSSLGGTQQFAATARDANGNQIPLSTFTWSSADPLIATVDASGLVTSVGSGSTTITAIAGGVSGTATLTVVQQAAAIDINPTSATLNALGVSQAFTAAVRDANGHVIPGATLSWRSLDPAIATIDASGTVTAVGNGATTIIVASGMATTTASVTVSQVAASVVVSPASVSLPSGATQQFSAVAFDANGHVVAGATFAWRSAVTRVARVDAAGLAVANEPGTTQIIARAGKAAGGATLTVQ